MSGSWMEWSDDHAFAYLYKATSYSNFPGVSSTMPETRAAGGLPCQETRLNLEKKCLKVWHYSQFSRETSCFVGSDDRLGWFAHYNHLERDVFMEKFCSFHLTFSVSPLGLTSWRLRVVLETRFAHWQSPGRDNQKDDDSFMIRSNRLTFWTMTPHWDRLLILRS